MIGWMLCVFSVEELLVTATYIIHSYTRAVSPVISLWVPMISAMAPWLIAFGVATAFLSLRLWGRYAVEVVLWLLAAFVGQAIYRILSGAGPDASLNPPMAVLLPVLCGIVAILMCCIFALHKPAVREAFAAAEAARKAGADGLFTQS